jgi:hypothetical protein
MLDFRNGLIPIQKKLGEIWLLWGNMTYLRLAFDDVEKLHRNLRQQI